MVGSVGDQQLFFREKEAFEGRSLQKRTKVGKKKQKRETSDFTSFRPGCASDFIVKHNLLRSLLCKINQKVCTTKGKRKVNVTIINIRWRIIHFRQQICNWQKSRVSFGGGSTKIDHLSILKYLSWSFRCLKVPKSIVLNTF